MASLVHDPMPAHRYDSGPTIDPAEMVTSSDFPTEMSSDSTPDTTVGYGVLIFPDSTIPITCKVIVLGRDESILNFERDYGDSLRISSASGIPHGSHTNGGLANAPPDNNDDEHDFDDESSSEMVQKHSAQGGAVRSYHFSSNKNGETVQRILLHPPADPKGLSDIRQVSKSHMRIYFSPKDGEWKMHMLGRNGGWLNEDYLKCASMVTLQSGDRLQISGLEFIFQANDEDDEDEDSVDDEEYSSSEEVHPTISTSGRSNGHLESDVAIDDNEDDESEEDEEDEDDDDDRRTGEKRARSRPSIGKPAAKRIKLKTSSKSSGRGKSKGKEPAATQETKEESTTPRPTSNKRRTDFNIEDYLRPGEEFQQRRGPGRPPANGVMSLREMRERKREQAIANGEDPAKGRIQGTKARKDSGADEDGETGPKRAKKRKRGEANDEGRTGSPEGDAEDGDEEKGKGRASTPVPQPKREDFTEEQLKKPEGTTQERLYVILQEATDPMPLPKIYQAIRDKWPWFHFTETSGWESSVRHTLSQHACFKAVGREGKGQLWELDRSIQLERKPRASQAAASRPPPQPAPNGVPNPPRYGPPTGPYQPQNYPGRYVPQQAPQTNGQRPPVPPQTSYHSQYVSGGLTTPRPTAPYPPNSSQTGNYSQTPRTSVNGTATPNGFAPRPQVPHPQSTQAPVHRHSPLPIGSGLRPPSAASPVSQTNGSAFKTPLRPAIEDVQEGIVPPLLKRFVEQMRQTADPARSELTAQETSKAIQWVMDHKTQRDAMPDPRIANAEIVKIIWSTMDTDLARWNKMKGNTSQPERPMSSNSNQVASSPQAGTNVTLSKSPASASVMSPPNDVPTQANGTVASTTSLASPSNENKTQAAPAEVS